MNHSCLLVCVFIVSTYCRAAAIPDYAALGYPDENGNFVLTEEGRKVAEKTKILPEARFWGTKPLGESGNLSWPTGFQHHAVFRRAAQRPTDDGDRKSVV